MRHYLHRLHQHLSLRSRWYEKWHDSEVGHIPLLRRLTPRRYHKVKAHKPFHWGALGLVSGLSLKTVVAAYLTIGIAFSVVPQALAAGKTWTSQADFNAWTKTKTSSSSSPGDLTLDGAPGADTVTNTITNPSSGDILLSKDGNYIWTGGGAFTGGIFYGYVSKMDVATNTVTLIATIPNFFNPLLLQSANGDYIYAISSSHNQIHRINVGTGTVDQVIDLGLYNSRGSRGLITRDGAYIYLTTSKSGVGYVTQVNLTTTATVNLLPLTGSGTITSSPLNVVESLDGNFIYVNSTTSYDSADPDHKGVLFKIDKATDTQLGTIAVPGYPDQMFVTSNGSLYVESHRCDYSPCTPSRSSLAKIDTATDSVMAIMNIGDSYPSAYTGSYDYNMVETADHNYLWVVNNFNSALNKISISGNSIVSTVSVPGVFKNQITITQDGRYIYVASTDFTTRTVYRINLTTETVEQTIGLSTSGHIVIESGNDLYVDTGSTVTKISHGAYTYETKGTGSQSYDAGSGTSNTWNSLTRVQTLNSQTAAYYAAANDTGTAPTVPSVATADTSSNWTGNGWTALSFTGDVATLSLSDSRYLYVGVYMGTSDTAVTPSLASLSLDYTPLTGPTVSVVAPNGSESYLVGTGSGAVSSIPLSWTLSDTTGVHHIRVQYSTDSGGSYSDISGATALANSATSYSWPPPTGLKSTSVRIKVIAENASNASLAEDTSNANFTIHSNATPGVVLSLPADTGSATAGSVAFSAAVTDVDTEDTVTADFQLATDAGFSTIVDSASGLSVSMTSGNGTFSRNVSLNPVSTTTYYWKVRATDNHSAQSAYTATRSFTITMVPNNAPTVTTLGPTGYRNGSLTTDTTPTLTFTTADVDSGDTVKYQIQVSTHTDYSSPVIDYTSSLATPGPVSYTPGSDLPDGPYYWRVKAVDSHDAASSWAIGSD